MVSKILKFGKQQKGSSLALPANGLGGSRATSLWVVHFALQNTASNSVRRKVLGAKPKQAGKKEWGWGEGIFARLLPFPFRFSKGKAEGGFGGNSAFPLRNQIEASPTTCLNTWKAEHRRKILFSF